MGKMDDRDTRATGFVLPVGSGGVGKTSLSRVLLEYNREQEAYEEVIQTRVTKNLEFEFVPLQWDQDGQEFRVLAQILVPPGQTMLAEQQAGRTYEQVIDIYRFHIRRVDVVILVYSILRDDSWKDLHYWAREVSDLTHDNTQYILLGTHLDQIEDRAVVWEDVAGERGELVNLLKEIQPSWKGSCELLEISNRTGENVQTLREMLAEGILKAGGYI